VLFRLVCYSKFIATHGFENHKIILLLRVTEEVITTLLENNLCFGLLSTRSSEFFHIHGSERWRNIKVKVMDWCSSSLIYFWFWFLLFKDNLFLYILRICFNSGIRMILIALNSRKWWSLAKSICMNPSNEHKTYENKWKTTFPLLFKFFLKINGIKVVKDYWSFPA